MTRAMWDWMLDDLRPRLAGGEHLFSGGSAWADHLAVHAFLRGWASALTLHLPAPFLFGRFIGPDMSSGSAANYYHDCFRAITGTKSLTEIVKALSSGASFTAQPAMPGHAAMFTRNALIAQCALDGIIAYTRSKGDQPTAGGTLSTWKSCRCERKEHIGIPFDC